MHRQTELLDSLLPEWSTTVALSIPFTLIFLFSTQDFLPEMLLDVVQNTMEQGPSHAGIPFAEVLVPVFFLYVLLACAVGLTVGTVINRFARYLWRLAECRETGY